MRALRTRIAWRSSWRASGATKPSRNRACCCPAASVTVPKRGAGGRDRRALQALARGQAPKAPGQAQGFAGAELPGDGQDEVLGPHLAPASGLQILDGEGGDRSWVPRPKIPRGWPAYMVRR